MFKSKRNLNTSADVKLDQSKHSVCSECSGFIDVAEISTSFPEARDRACNSKPRSAESGGEHSQPNASRVTARHPLPKPSMSAAAAPSVIMYS